MNDVPWSIPVHYSMGLGDWIWGFGCTSNPRVLWLKDMKSQGYHRIVICPHCKNKVEVPKYTRSGKVTMCDICNDTFRYQPSL